MKKPTENLKKKIYLELYDITFELCLTDDVAGAAKKEFQVPESALKDLYADGLTLANRRNVVVIFKRSNLSYNLVAHEVFHATHCALQLCSAKFNEDDHEPFAYMNGWLHQWVYSVLKKHGVTVR